MSAMFSEPGIYGHLFTDRNGHTDELHVAKLLAVNRTLVTVSKWP